MRYIYTPPLTMGTKKSERMFWTLLSPAQPSYTALTGPETAICERPRAGDKKSDQFCHHSIPPNSPLTRRLGAKSQNQRHHTVTFSVIFCHVANMAPSGRLRALG
jgi:hypothetical protein